MDNTPLTAWREASRAAMAVSPTIEPWRPEPLDHDHWPPDYRRVYAWRMKTLKLFRDDPEKLRSARAYYKTRPAEFILHWIDTYDPRRSDGPKWMPFILFKRQHELLQFLIDCDANQESGLIEKCRDAGVTWLACAWAVHGWLFRAGYAVGFGSRKEVLVDDIGNPDSIFEKMRLILRRIPSIWLPPTFSFKEHSKSLNIINPDNGSIISGEAGDNIGRGGRKSVFLKDESAFYERPEKIEAALGDNTRVQIDISSVNGIGNVFHRRREAGVEWFAGREIAPGFTRVFTFDWRQHPGKTQQWYDDRKARYAREGLAHVFASEVDRDYSAAVSNRLIPFEELQVCIDAHKRIKYKDTKGFIRVGIPNELIGDNWMAGLDVADDGNDSNAIVKRQSIICRYCEDWSERDPGVTTRRAIAAVRAHKGIKVFYDCIGLGASVKSEYNRLTLDEKILTPGDVLFVPWNAGDSVQRGYERIIPNDQESSLIRDFFENLKAQAWWSLRTRVYKTWNNIVNGVFYPIDELISFDSAMPQLMQLLKELSQPTRGESSSLKMLVNKKPSGTKSPNLADACVMAYFPIETNSTILVGRYGL